MKKYKDRINRNPIDSYINGLCLWLTPRQIIVLEKMCKFFKDDPTLTPGSADQQAFLDFKEQIDHEAEIKKRKYFGGDDEEAYSLFDPS